MRQRQRGKVVVRSQPLVLARVRALHGGVGKIYTIRGLGVARGGRGLWIPSAQGTPRHPGEGVGREGYHRDARVAVGYDRTTRRKAPGDQKHHRTVTINCAGSAAAPLSL